MSMECGYLEKSSMNRLAWLEASNKPRAQLPAKLRQCNGLWPCEREGGAMAVGLVWTVTIGFLWWRRGKLSIARASSSQG